MAGCSLISDQVAAEGSVETGDESVSPWLVKGEQESRVARSRGCGDNDGGSSERVPDPLLCSLLRYTDSGSGNDPLRKQAGFTPTPLDLSLSLSLFPASFAADSMFGSQDAQLMSITAIFASAFAVESTCLRAASTLYKATD